MYEYADWLGYIQGPILKLYKVNGAQNLEFKKVTLKSSHITVLSWKWKSTNIKK